MLKYYFTPVFIKFALVGYACIVAFWVALSWAVHFSSKFWVFYPDELSICDAFRNLTSFVQYKKHKYTQQRGLLLLVNLQATKVYNFIKTLLKVTLLPGYFHVFETVHIVPILQIVQILEGFTGKEGVTFFRGLQFLHKK